MYAEKQPPSLSAILTTLRDFVAYHSSKLWANERSRYFAIGGVCVVALLMWFRSGSSSNDVRNIERVLAEDAKTTPGATSVAQVVTRMRAIDLTDCPNDFKAAYLAHIHSWEAMGGIEQEAIAFKTESESGGAMVESFFRGMLGDPLGKMNEINAAQGHLKARYEYASQELKSTYNRVEEVAVAHGATLAKKPGGG